ncbi:GAF sensor signal transduction histidine kinase [[Leptolyngbya] sp. PCC 7376]|uniref:GAF domain-containing sensor histidine kinase n=1 Tax=[Leptolyngbya] sp. PCC 7376 TaxID=111781 RepID=UPI00029F059A|nr:GAF domain-containing protein [[Leptolyngbya] sp. PCC 7376]AFY40510.1 GAF sensor signal transduction histidine kinase [[Leptolyngbya] sp. PCC 7376]
MSPNPKINALQQAAHQLAVCTDQLFQQIEQEQVLDGIIERIRSCLELDDVFHETSTSIRQLLSADRVGVFRFTPGSGWDEGEFVAENVRKEFPSAMAAKVYDHCFGSQYAVHYTEGRIQSVADIYDANLSDCHIQILEQFQVRANLIVPVLKGKELWGLLCIHQCSHPRRWQLAEIGFVQKIAIHFAIALQQAENREQIKLQAAQLIQAKAQQEALTRQKALVKIVSNIRQSLDFADICNTTTAEVRHLLEADRVIIYRFNPDWSGNFLFESVAAEWKPLVGVSPSIEDTHLMETQGGRYAAGETFAIPNIYEAGHSDCHVELLEEFQAKAYAIAPIFRDDNLWGLLATFQNSSPRHWQTDEVELLAQVGEQLGIALQQASKQTKAINRQKILVKLVSKIRQSLELEEICQTATTEIRQLLNADRVTIYRFNPDWSGNFLFESVTSEWQPLVGVSPVIEDTHLMDTQGGRYAAGETFAIPDIYDAGHSDCHIELLEQFQAKAYAIAPIFQDDHLWGLLATFQNSGPRHWQTDEVELLAQVGEQLGIALQQTEFVRQLQSQSTELKDLFEALQQSQLQLIQNEKMASLGQLVAGVAHEINNPINFIHGNLPHINDYVKDLLILACEYQKTSPNSAEDIQKLQERTEELDLDFILEDLPKVLSSMQMGTDRIRQIVLSLRNFSRLDEAEFKAVNIHEGLDSTLLILGNRLKFCDTNTSIDIIKKYSDIPLVECFPAQLNQVFMNLLSNSIDAIEEVLRKKAKSTSKKTRNWKPKIWIKTQLDGIDHIQISIRDNGIGIPETDENKLFDHFFTTKSIGKGTGLGLSISHEIISQKHGGQLNFKSIKKGGAEFIIRLPIKFQG